MHTTAHSLPAPAAAASQRNVHTQHALGTCYRHRVDVDADATTAAEWLAEATHGGHRPAQLELSQLQLPQLQLPQLQLPQLQLPQLQLPQLQLPQPQLSQLELPQCRDVQGGTDVGPQQAINSTHTACRAHVAASATTPHSFAVVAARCTLAVL